MNLFVLSELHPGHNHVGWTVSHSLEETLASACDATFIYPLENTEFKLPGGIQLSGHSTAAINRFRHRLYKSWFTLSELPSLGQGLNVLLVVGLNPHFLLSMHTLGPLLKQFDLRLGYLLDGFDPVNIDRSVLPLLDHLFVMNAEIVDEIKVRHGISTSFLPLATNTIHTHLSSQPRWIDIISYGRGNQDFHRCLQHHFNHPESKRVYYHSTFSKPEVHDRREHISLLSKLLERSKISLCFEGSDIKRFMGYSPLLYRWFEAWAAGCTIVGKKPFGQGVAELMDWENSTYEVPEYPSEWIPFLEELLADEATLLANSQRNYRECLLRHDWRHRLCDLLQTVGLALPDSLVMEMVHLQNKASAIAPAASVHAFSNGVRV